MLMFERGVNGRVRCWLIELVEVPLLETVRLDKCSFLEDNKLYCGDLLDGSILFE